jgi:hypothetical protein
MPDAPTEETPRPVRESFDWGTGDFDAIAERQLYGDPDARFHTLRIDLATVTMHQIEAVTFSKQAMAVTRRRIDPEEYSFSGQATIKPPSETGRPRTRSASRPFYLFR